MASVAAFLARVLKPLWGTIIEAMIKLKERPETGRRASPDEEARKARERLAKLRRKHAGKCLWLLLVCAGLAGCTRRDVVLVEPGGFARTVNPIETDLLVPIAGGEYEIRRGTIPAGWYVLAPEAEDEIGQ